MEAYVIKWGTRWRGWGEDHYVRALNNAHWFHTRARAESLAIPGETVHKVTVENTIKIKLVEDAS